MEILSNIIFYFFSFIIVLSIIVFVHEFGHYFIAILNKVIVETFSIGFGKEIYGWNDKRGTRWKISILPFGGYVKMFGEDTFSKSKIPSSLKKYAFSNKTVYRQRKSKKRGFSFSDMASGAQKRKIAASKKKKESSVKEKSYGFSFSELAGKTQRKSTGNKRIK